MKKCFSKILAFSVLAISTAWSQDVHFTQFYVAPTALNPSMTGLFDSKFRVAFIQRQQWKNALDHPFSTTYASMDFRFKSFLKSNRNDHWGVGVSFYKDVVNSIGYTRNQIAMHTAYHKALDNKGFTLLSAGLSMSINQQNLDYGNLYFGDQYNGVAGYDLATNEILPLNNFSYFDLVAGVGYAFRFNDRVKMHLGGSVHHFNRPNVDFYEVNYALPVKYAFHANMQYAPNARITLSPRIQILNQGKHLQVTPGANLKLYPNDYSYFAFHTGIWSRFAQTESTPLKPESIILFGGIEFRGILVGASYDMNVTDQPILRRNALEISIGYSGEYESESQICPVF